MGRNVLMEFDMEEKGWKRKALRALESGETFALVARKKHAERIRYYLDKLEPRATRSFGLLDMFRIVRVASFHFVFTNAVGLGKLISSASPDPETVVVVFASR